MTPQPTPTGWDRVPDTRDTRHSFMYDDLQGATSIAPGLSLSDWRQLDNAARKAGQR